MTTTTRRELSADFDKVVLRAKDARCELEIHIENLKNVEAAVHHIQEARRIDQAVRDNICEQLWNAILEVEAANANQ